ncbi:uncharacterized protein METZ01_LOCUS495701, partial [marine metagenome]
MTSTIAESKFLAPWLRVLCRCFQKLGVHTTPPKQLKEKYASSNSRYLSIDDTVIHYQDEGEGPVLILSHGALASLHTWDGWVDALKSKYRLIRFDIPGFGLSGPNGNKQFNPEYAEKWLSLFV